LRLLDLKQRLMRASPARITLPGFICGRSNPRCVPRRRFLSRSLPAGPEVGNR